MAKSEYYHVTDGEWIRVPLRNYKEQCCDCSLIHRLNFKIKKDKNGRNELWIQTFRDGKSTGGARAGSS